MKKENERNIKRQKSLFNSWARRINIMQMGFSSSNLGIQLNTSHSTNISFPEKSILKFTWKKTDSQSTKGSAQSITISDYIL